MKIFKIGMIVLTITMVFAMFGCDDPSSGYFKEQTETSKKEFSTLFKKADDFYGSPHQLRKVFVEDRETTVKTPDSGDFSGGFFFFIGEVSGNYKEGVEKKYVTTYVRFAWEIKDNIYVVTTLPLEKIRIKITEEIKTPTISFFLSKYGVHKKWWTRDNTYEFKFQEEIRKTILDYNNPNEILSQYLAYAVFTVEEKDWPQNINPPMN